jgi:hypothetical protein
VSRPSRWHGSMPLLAKDDDWTSPALANNVVGRIQRDAWRRGLADDYHGTQLFGRERDVSRHACRYLSDTGLLAPRSWTSENPGPWWRVVPILVTKFTIIGTLLPLSRPVLRQIGHTLKIGSSESGHVLDGWATLDPHVRYMWRKCPSNGEQGHRRSP